MILEERLSSDRLSSVRSYLRPALVIAPLLEVLTAAGRRERLGRRGLLLATGGAGLAWVTFFGLLVRGFCGCLGGAASW